MSELQSCSHAKAPLTSAQVQPLWGKEGGIDGCCLARATLPVCRARGSRDWEELQVPRTPAETQA